MLNCKLESYPWLAACGTCVYPLDPLGFLEVFVGRCHLSCVLTGYFSPANLSSTPDLHVGSAQMDVTARLLSKPAFL